jgi:hypothetical protein
MNRGYIRLPHYGYGFFSNFFRILDHIKTAVDMGLEPYVDYKHTAWVNGYNPFTDARPPKNAENPWDWWFEQRPLGSDIPAKVELDHLIFMHHTQVWKRGDVPMFREVFDNHVKIKQHILDKVDDIYNREFKGKTVLGVMARGCEFNAGHPDFGNQQLEDWLRKTKDVLHDNEEIDKVFVVTEDGHYLPVFDNWFNNVFYLKDVFRRTEETLEYMNSVGLWAIIADKRPNHKKLLGEECLIQALLLSKCDYLICKVCGTANAAVFFSDNLKEVYYI